MNKDKVSWLFLDLNSYFASVEQQDQPHLRGKPVAVLPSMTDATCAIAASYEAKAYGVKTGTKIYEAKKMCPNLICVQANPKKYVEYHHKILAAADTVLPVHKVWSVDEFDCLLLGKEREPENAIKIAHKLKDALHRDVGEYINCSIGLAPNSFLAKVCTEIQKPDGLVCLTPNDLPGALLTLKLTDLPGINVAMLDRLNKAGVHSVEDLWHTAPKQCRAIWRSVQGERFWYWLHGHDVPYQKTNPSMIGHSRMLDPKMRHIDGLRRKGYCAKTLAFKVRFIGGGKWGYSRDFPATDNPFVIMKHLDSLWDQMTIDCFGMKLPSPNQMIFLKVSTLLLGLVEPHDITNDLFETEIIETKDKNIKQQQLAVALDDLQKKYNKETVWLGVVPETLAGNVGTKIAFNRVPDKEEFWN